ncbi:trafficking protein particle complex subunit 2-like protein isoform X1 [Tursiops truncatus]|uniref:Trafficking protein particle complex subunit 2-like protein n=1 Tax=Tursiops truncatus TaxID=9739 RepID=A0A6J3QIC1_TURTR|nr:trafficking protein particle complex subunit 2-like protein isoform X1 [Tursiops truncatus]
MAVCVAVIAKENYPLYIRSVPTENELKFHYMVHTSLDVVDEKISAMGKALVDQRELYLGLLYPTEDYKVYPHTWQWLRVWGFPAVAGLCTVMPCLGLSQSPRIKSVFPNQLCSYGYVTNSKVKFVMVVDSSNTALRDNEIRSMFRKLHNSYTDVMCNPFYNPGDRIQSRAFDGMVTSMMIQARQPRGSCVSWLSLGIAEKVWVGALATHMGCLGLKSTGKEGLKGPLSSQWPRRRD